MVTKKFFKDIYSRVPKVALHAIGRSRGEYLFFLLMSYVIAWTGNLCGAFTDPFLSFLLPIFDFYLICIIINGLKRYKLGWLLTIPTILLLTAEQFVVLFYHSYISLHIVQLLAETNSKESTEFLASAITQPSFWQTFAIIVAVMAVAVMLGRLSRSTFRFKQLCVFLACALILWSGIRQLSAYKKITHCFLSSSIAECGKPQNIPHLNTPMVRTLYGLAFNVAASKELETLETSVESSEVDGCGFKCPLILLIIGESYNKYHTPLYNQDYLPTTPRLSSLQEQGMLFAHKNAVSPFNLTSNVFKYMFSTWDEDKEDDWTAHTLFPALFRKAGYRVLFLTNQFAMESNDQWNVLGGTIFNRPKLSELQFSYRNKSTYEYDHELLQELPPLDSLTAVPTLIIIHLIGQHVRYADRYPLEYKRFTPDEEHTLFGGEQGKVIAADYDNATYYNDAVVNDVFQQFGNTEAIGIYLSDHGEEVYDWRAQYERTSEGEISQEIARYQYEIPLLFYLTPLFQLLHEDITHEVQTALEKPFISTDIPHLLLYLGGIQCKDYEESKNILSPHYDLHRKRILRNQVDYDKLMRE